MLFRSSAPNVDPAKLPDGVRLTSWRQLLDLGSLQEGEDHLAATARKAVARLSKATADRFAITTSIKISTPKGSITLPVEISSMEDGVVWIPENSVGSQRFTLGADSHITIGAGA